MAIDLNFDKANYPAPLCGIDEVGRGPLIGPVIAACVFIQNSNLLLFKGINDSKKLSEKKRDVFYTLIKENTLFGIGIASAKEIDTINILQASLLAMKRAYETMIQDFNISPICAVIDGNKPPSLPIKLHMLIKGDAKSPSIAAASILAKVTRDRLIVKMAQQYPHYGWESNKGYPTPFHLDALKIYGVTPYHRMTYKPVSNLLRGAV